MSTKFGIALCLPTLPGGGLDPVGLRRRLKELAAMGTGFVVPSGNAGNLPAFDRLHAIAIVAEEFQGRAAVLAPAQGTILSGIIRSARQLQSLGVAGVLCPPPLAGSSQKHALEHFQALAAALTVDIIVDNAARPARTRLALSSLLRLAEIPAIGGVKESPAGRARLIEIAQALPSRFAVLCASEDATMTLTTIGTKRAGAPEAPLSAA